VSEKRSPGSPFFHQTREGTTPSTLRSIEVAEELAPDTEQQLPPVYVEPQPLPALSNHKTIEIQTVKLADDIDPRKLPTELRLVRPPSVPPPDSGWPYSEAALAATQPPNVERRRSRARIAVAALLGLLLLGSGVAWRKRASLANAAPPASARMLAAAPEFPTAALPAAVPVVTDSASGIADLAAASPSASVAEITSAAAAAPSAPSSALAAVSTPSLSASTGTTVKPRHHAVTRVAAPSSAATQTSRDPTPSSPSKPKRAIY